MTSRKFFKTDRNRSSIQSHSLSSMSPSSIQQSIIDDFETSDVMDAQESRSNKRKLGLNPDIEYNPLDDVHENNNYNHNGIDLQHDHSDSESSGFHSSYNDCYDSFDMIDDFDPIFRCSTPNQVDRYELNDEGVHNWPSSGDEEHHRMNLWDRAIQRNEKLREWIDDFNRQIESVDRTEIAIRMIDDK
ncbi:unc-112-related protein [Sarcoptes scabiei]|nr:unc-112-related protein [Sarcoptes scabiei]